MSAESPNSQNNSKLVPLGHNHEPVDLDSPDFVVEPLADSPHEQSWVRDRLEVIRRHFIFILAITVASAGIATYGVRKAVPIYRATATVRFIDTRSNLTSGVGSNVPGQMSWNVDAIKSQMQLFATRATAEDAVDEGKLQLRELGSHESIDWLSDVDASNLSASDTLRVRFQDSAFSATLGRASASAAYSQPVKVGGISFTVPTRPKSDSAIFEVSPREQVISAVQGGLKATRRVDTDIADVSFIGPDPYFAQRALNAATLSLQALSIKASQKTARARRQFLDQQLRKSDSVLEIQRAQLSAFRSASQTFSAKDRMAAEQTSLTSIRIRREELRADRDVYVSLLGRARATQQSGDTDRLRTLVSAPGISANPAIMELYQQFVQLKTARDSLTTGPFPAALTNPDVLRLNALMQSAGNQLIAAVRSQIEGLDARIAALDALGSRSSAQASSLPQTEAEEARLIQEEEGTQRIAEQLRQEQQRATISEVAEGGQVQVIDMARQPGSPINSAQYRKILLAALVALILAIELALVIDSLNKSFRKTSEVERVLRLPILGAIPKLNKTHKAVPLKIAGVRLPALRKSKGTALAENGSSSLAIVDPTLPEFESFRALRTSLMFSNAVRSLRSIVVTSAVPGDGKSTIAANLAAAFAQQGMRVIAIDCDIRKGRLHKLFGFSSTPGLMEVVLGKISLAEAIHQTSVPNLSLLTCGKNPPNPTELLGSAAVRSILAGLNNDYDLLMIDTPPVLATADAAVLGSMVDGVVVIVRVGATERGAAKRAVDRMRATGARVVGTVLNDPDEVLDSQEEYYHYQYNYGDRALTR